MKKLLLSLIFLLAFVSIKTDTATNEALEQTEFTEKNNQLILQAVFGEQPVKDKAFFDLSIKGIWSEKLLPLLTNKKFLILLLSSFSAVQIFRLSSIAYKIACNSNLFHRFDLYNSFDMNACLLLLPHAILTGCIMTDFIFQWIIKFKQ